MDEPQNTLKGNAIVGRSSPTRLQSETTVLEETSATQPVSIQRQPVREETINADFYMPKTQRRNNIQSSSDLFPPAANERIQRPNFETTSPESLNRTNAERPKTLPTGNSQADNAIEEEVDQLMNRLQDLRQLEKSSELLNQNSVAPGASLHPSNKTRDIVQSEISNEKPNEKSNEFVGFESKPKTPPVVAQPVKTTINKPQETASEASDKTSLFLNSGLEKSTTPAFNKDGVSAPPASLDNEDAASHESVEDLKVASEDAGNFRPVAAEIPPVQNEFAQDIPAPRKPELDVTTVPAQPLSAQTPISSPPKNVPTIESNAETSEPQPLVLRAVPNGNHRLISNYIPRNSGQTNVGSNLLSQAPSRRASFLPPPRKNSTSQSLASERYLPNVDTDFRSLPNIELPRLSRAGLPASRTMSLRSEVESAETKEKLRDIQTIVKYEIDKRIQAGQLIVPTDEMLPREPMMPTSESVPMPPSVETERAPAPVAKPPVSKQTAAAPVVTEMPETNDAVKVPKINATELKPSKSGPSNSKVKIQIQRPAPAIAESNVTASIRTMPPKLEPPTRRPSVPIQVVESVDFDLQDEPATEIVAESRPNLFIPVLKIENNELDSRPEVGAIELKVNSQPIPAEPQQAGTSEQTASDIWRTPAPEPAKPIRKLEAETRPITKQNPQIPNLIRTAPPTSQEILRLRAVSTPGYEESAPPIVRFRKISTKFRYINPNEALISPQKKARILRPGMEGQEQIQTIKAAPVYRDDEFIREIRGLSELPSNENSATIKIIER